MCNIAQVVCLGIVAYFCTSDFCVGWGGVIYWTISLLRMAIRRCLYVKCCEKKYVKRLPQL